MMFQETADNQSYLAARGKIALNACPGSGKTTAVAYKLSALSEECLQKHGRFSGIACLSFTNVAKSEISDKFKSMHGRSLAYPHFISTIDSFINQYITLPFYYLLGYTAKRPVIMDVVGFLDEMNLGYFQGKNRKPLKFSYKPSELKIEIDGNYTFKGKVPDTKNVDLQIFSKYAAKYKNWQFDNGYLNNDDSAYAACKLLERYPKIASALVERFPYFVIDEVQDTSDVQYQILDHLITQGLTNVELVGDPYQSLYEFRNARPDLFMQRFEDTKNWQALRLTNCRRSSQHIINSYNIFRETKEPPIVSTCTHTTDHKLHIIRFSPDDPGGLINKYQSLIDVEKDNRILVRGGTHLTMFGANPSSENPWKSILAQQLINAFLLFEKGELKDSIDLIRKVFASCMNPGKNWGELKSDIDLLKKDILLNVSLFDFLKNFPPINDSIAEWHKKITKHLLLAVGQPIDLELKQKGKIYLGQNLKDLMFPAVVNPIPVSTIHKAKGKTFYSTLLVLSETSTSANISLSDFISPRGLPSDKQRLIYVAMSRPEVLSCLGVPDVWSEEKIIDKLGKDIVFI